MTTATVFESANKSYINGSWTEGASERTYDILNPFDQSLVAQVRLASLEQVRQAFETARNAQKEWAKSTVEQRKEVIRKAAEYLKDNHDSIVDLIVRETGGSHLKANVEIHLTMGVLEEALHYADEIDQVREVSSGIPGKVNQIYRLPLGVVSSISPFNFPLILSARTIAPAIALGNSVVHKPDIQVGLTGGSVLARAFEYAGLPKGVFNVVLTDIPEIGDEMLTNPIPKLVSFTGSTAVGRHVGKIAGENLKRAILELGGNSPFVVLSDADVDRAVDAAVFGKFTHQGQICMAINRMIVHRDVYDEFVEKFTARAKEIPCGDPRDPKNIIGPIINQKQLEKALNLIEEAKQSGVKMALEGKREGSVITPYVWVDVDNDSKFAQSELFAPIAVIVKADSDEDAVRMAGETEYGLSSSIFTCDLEKGKRFALQIDSGMTHINDQTVNDEPNVPFGGNKGSGTGRFGNPWIVEEFTVMKWVSVQQEYRQFPY